MKTIFKYTLNFPTDIIQIQKGAKLLSVQQQANRNADPSSHGWIDGAARLWAMVDETAPKINRRVQIVPTGAAMEGEVPTWDYVATIQDGPYVWHVFIEPER